MPTERKITIHNITRNDWDNIAIHYDPKNITEEQIMKIINYSKKINKKRNLFFEKSSHRFIEVQTIFLTGEPILCTYATNVNKQVIELEDFLAEPTEEKLSSCCQASIKTDCGDEGTCCFMCSKCNKPCDIYVEEELPNVRGDNPEYPEDEEQETFDHKTALKKAIDGEKVIRKKYQDDSYDKNDITCFVLSFNEISREFDDCFNSYPEDAEATDWMIYKEPTKKVTTTMREAIKQGLSFEFEGLKYEYGKLHGNEGSLVCDCVFVPTIFIIQNQDKQVTIIEE